MYDSIVIGGGPAGLSAAIALRSRDRSVLVVTNDFHNNPLAKAEQIDNYLGMPRLTGAEMLERFHEHALAAGVEFKEGKALSAVDLGTSYFLSVGTDVIEAKTLILAAGVARGKKFAGEAELLGKGVSYCATCDGMLYRGKKVVVVGRSTEAPADANFLAQIGCAVTYIAPKRPEGLADGIEFLKGARVEVLGDGKVEAVRLGDTEIPCEGVFVLRESVAPNDLLPALELEDGYIKVDRAMRTSLRNVFAAGDCTGKPLQVAKAVGEGLVAGEAADEVIAEEERNA